MVQRFKLLIPPVLVLALVFTITPFDEALASDCVASDWLIGSCPVSASNNGTEVTLEGTVRTPGGGGRGSHAGTGGGAATPADPSQPAVVRDNYTVTMPVTLSDVARFRPNPGIDLMEPNGWMIVGLSTNFYAHATQHIKAGTLLGGPASVRFTPVRYAWTYGDGATRTTSTPGATWAAQRINEFDATPTSHIYRAPGRYVIDLTIGYAPEYRLESSTEWIPVSGLVWVPANRLVAVASGGAKTVLVEDECTINPSGPGC
ncbi:MAG: hypothetical protein IT190_01035 [Microbacteriaceae bacterium]|nr:hypothetical protein [Microbacteriaceae bacterium]